jgi:uncharacterized protein (TIGR02001 family)
LCAVAGVSLFALTSAAFAGGSLKDEPKPEREFTYSFSITGTSDYVFRGQTQTDGEPALQGSVGIGYGIFYAGAWASSVDFGGEDGLGIGSDSQVEIDFYTGIKPTWGPATFDFGVIYYAYPGANDFATELDYVEIKAGVSGEVLKSLTATGTVYYSPEYTGETGEAWTFEGALAYALPKTWIFTPTISGTLGHTDVELLPIGEWTYWNAGVSLAVDKLTLDFRYWGSDLDIPDNVIFGAGDRFVFSATVALP